MAKWNFSMTNDDQDMIDECTLLGKGPQSKDCAHWVYKHPDGRYFATLMGISIDWGADMHGILEITEGEVEEYI